MIRRPKSKHLNWRHMLDRVSSNTAGLAIKTGYFLLAAMTLVFVVMLILTILHP